MRSGMGWSSDYYGYHSFSIDLFYYLVKNVIICRYFQDSGIRESVSGKDTSCSVVQGMSNGPRGKHHLN